MITLEQEVGGGEYATGTVVGGDMAGAAVDAHESVKLLSKDVNKVTSEVKKMESSLGLLREGLDVLQDEVVAMSHTHQSHSNSVEEKLLATSTKLGELEKTVVGMTLTAGALRLSGAGAGGLMCWLALVLIYLFVFS